MPQTWRATIAPFIAAGWDERSLLPEVPVGAKLTEGSKLSPDDLGKIPGEYHGNGRWSGRARWQQRWTEAQRKEAEAWPTPQVGVYADYLQGIDCDTRSGPRAWQVSELALRGLCQVLGIDPDQLQLRSRTESARWLVPVRGLIGRFPLLELRDEQGELLARLEFKTSGQWVAAGQHPAGDHYTWRRGIPRTNDIPAFTAEQLPALQEELQRLLASEGITLRVGKAKAAGAHAGAAAGHDRRRVSQLPQLLSFDLLEELTEKLDCNRETVEGHDEAVKVYAAFAAVLGEAGWPDAPACLEAWASTYPGTSAEAEANWFRQRWASFESVSQGPTGFCAWVQRMVREGHLEAEIGARVVHEVRSGQARDEFDRVDEDPGEVPPEANRYPPHQAALEDEDVQQALNACCAAYVYREEADEWISLATLNMMTPKQLDSTTLCLQLAKVYDAAARKAGRQIARPMRASRILLDHARRVRGVTYLPGAERFVEVKPGVTYFNRWNRPERPLLGQEITEQDIASYLELLKHLLPDQRDRTLFLDWCCHIAQHPEIKVEWMPILLSLVEGTGKDTALLPAREAVGLDNWAMIQLQDLLQTHNSHWIESQVVLVMELPPGKTRDTAIILKGHIASASGDRTVNPKYVRPYRVPDRCSWVGTTNHRDAVDLTHHDRRYGILGTREVQLPECLAEAVHAFFDKDGSRRGLQLVAEYFRRRPISAAFNPKRCPAPSEAKQRMRLEGLEGSPAGHLYRRLTEQDIEGSLVGRRLLWWREVEEILDGVRRDSRWHGRPVHVSVAVEEAGWRHHPRAREGGRLVVGGKQVDGVRAKQLGIKALVRTDDGTVLELEPRQVLEMLHEELRTHGRDDLVENLGRLLSEVDAPPEEGGAVNLERERAKRRRRYTWE